MSAKDTTWSNNSAKIPVIETVLLPGMEEHAEDLRMFFDAMMHKLYKNRHKGKWQYGIEEGMVKLEKEVEELRIAVASYNLAWILEEAADVGNTALIVASIRLRQLQGDSVLSQISKELDDLPTNQGDGKVSLKVNVASTRPI